MAQIDERIKAADKLIEEAEAKHDQTTGPLHAHQREPLDARNEATRASSELYNTCEDP